MIPRECKRLAEVDFPIAEVSRHAVREKPIVRNHPQSFHQWWARRPLASSRAILMALLLPDPCDRHCPDAFKRKARSILGAIRQSPVNDADLRRGLLSFIANYANWDNAADRTHIDVSRALVKAAHGDEPPLVVDPFAGGGSIPLEALRVGCDGFATDLNPVACLILKVMLEDIPRQDSGIAEQLHRIGGEVEQTAKMVLAELYPTDSDGATPIAYLWARTVRCEAPNCGAEIPLLRSFWLCRKPKRKRALRHRVEFFEGHPPSVRFEVYEPTTEREVHDGTVTRARATCLCCNTVLQPERVRAQLSAQSGGADAVFDETGQRVGGALMTAVVTLKPGKPGRHYRLPNDADYKAVARSQEKMLDIIGEWERCGKSGLCPVPDEPLPTERKRGSSGFRVLLYGMNVWGDLFTARQKVALAEICRISQESKGVGISNNLVGLIISRLADRLASLVGWDVGGEKLGHVFSRQALPIVWDFTEGAPFSGASGSYRNISNQIRGAVQGVSAIAGTTAQVQSADATAHPLPDQAASVWFTDPPYYDAVAYADLSDFFLVWLKRALPKHPLLRDFHDPNFPLSPKDREAIQDPGRFVNGSAKDKGFYESKMAAAFAEGRRVLREDGVGTVVFAHKTTEGWEALVSGMIRGGWTITGSWPIATERGSRLNAHNSSALATSVHLICRPRLEDAPIGDWGDVLRELPARVAEWIERLQRDGIRGADLVFACIGPALEIFSRYREVETAEGETVGLAEYLERVWEVVGRAALQQVLGADQAGALEEDARLTALFLWTLQTTETRPDDGKPEQPDEEGASKATAKGLNLPFDVVRRFAQPMGINLDAWTDRIIGQKKGVVRLLPVSERAGSLFGAAGTTVVAERIERDPHSDVQQKLFADLDKPAPSLVREPRMGYGESADDESDRAPGDTTLDRVHAAMLFQSSGHANALRELIGAEQERGPDFLRLANALSALYPRGSNEKRLLDAMILAVPS